MECIDRIFYRKINPSDFKKLYDIDIPSGGGGQTYLEAAGITNDKIVDFLSYAEIKDSPLKDEERSIYTFNSYTLGKPDDAPELIEFAPRKGRNNYRISRQNMKYKHSAWRMENGFPEPNKDEDGKYTSEGDFEGIIDNLIIIIIRTTYRKYYASFLNTSTMPDTWPNDLGLEKIFSDDRRGVLDLERFNVAFINDKDMPFGNHEILDRKSGGSNTLLYGVPGAGKSWTIDHEYCSDEIHMQRIVFHPDYTYSDFVGQILPNVSDGNVSYAFTPGPFTKIMKQAYTHPSEEYFLVIEEINRGNAPAIFGEVFQLLDRCTSDTATDELPEGSSEYGINNPDIAEVVYDNPNHPVRIPSNLSIIATMNTSDQNVFTLDTAFQRRWNMRMIENSFDKADKAFADKEILDTSVTWRQFCTEINSIILEKNVRMASSEDKRLGVYFVHLNDLTYDDTSLEGLSELEAAKVIRKNRKFAEKVLKYLWDDAFKFRRDDIFEISQYNSLEALINKFMDETGDARFTIFKQAVYDALTSSDESE